MKNEVENHLIQVSVKDTIDKMTTIMEKLYEAASATLLPSLPELIFVLRCLVTLAVLFASFVITRWVFRIVRLFAGMFEPMNYELDMTTKNYCKNLAELDNSLRFQTLPQCDGIRPTRTAAAADTLQSTGDCATPNTSLESNGNIRSFNQALSGGGGGGESELEARATKDADDYVYPNGWLPVMESSKVGPGQIKRAIILGRDVIVTRSLEGQANVLDAYCPHMGVHIGVGGKVLRVNDESCVQCPFHGWTFRATDGQCVRVPYAAQNGSNCSTNIPKQAKLNVWTCDEVNNMIFIWHHIDGLPPSWHLEQTPELNDPSWLLNGRSCHKTNLDLRDMHENGADMNHFDGIHNDLFVFGGEYLKVQSYNWFQKYARHHWAPNWSPIVSDDGKTTHTAKLSLRSWISLFRMRLFDISLHATQIGPACVVLKFKSNWYGQGVLNMYSIPLGGRRTLYVQHIYSPNIYFDRFMSKWVLFGEIKQLERDLFMWNHKKTLANPVFMPEDKITKRFRLWYSQFYKRKRKITIDSSPTEKRVVSSGSRETTLAHCLSNNMEF